MGAPTKKLIRALVVDDEADFRDLLALSLRRRGYEVAQADGGIVALEMIRKNSFDIVISDVRMPKGDGLYLLQQARSCIKNLPVILLVTGYDDIDSENATRHGAKALFSKPVDASSLDETIAKILDQQNVEKKQRFPRVKTEITAMIESENGIPGTKAVVKNISRGGVYVELECEKCPDVNSAITVRLDIDQSGQPLKASGVIRWTRVEKVHGVFGCGVEFTQIESGLHESIEDLFKKAA